MKALLAFFRDVFRRSFGEKFSYFKAQAGSLYNGFLGQGYSSSEAVELTTSALKAKNHPWAGYDVVKSVLSSSGQFKKNKGVV